MVNNKLQLYTSGVISVVAAIPGDFNDSGVVDAGDYIVWRKHNGSLSDFNLWRANFGRTFGSGTSTAALEGSNVPEPSSVVMLLIAAAFVRLARRRTA